MFMGLSKLLWTFELCLVASISRVGYAEEGNGNWLSGCLIMGRFFATCHLLESSGHK